MKPLFILTLTILFCTPIRAYAQTPEAGRTFNFENWFDAQVGIENTSLINASLYFPSRNGYRSHPYFQSQNGQTGKILYGDHLFRDVQLLFDLHNDKIILRQQKPNGEVLLLALQQELVYYFYLGESVFKQFNHEELRDEFGGFAEVKYEGKKVSLLAKRKKYQKIVDRQLVYVEQIRYYYQIDKQLINSKGKKVLLGIFPEQANQIDKYIKDNKLKTNGSSEADLIKLAKYLDSLGRL